LGDVETASGEKRKEGIAELMSEPKLSVYMITYNNERTVRKALESVRWADEVVVVDSFSDDKTVEICREFTDKVFQRKWPGFRDQYQHAAEQTSHPWVLFLDADEEISNELAQEIRTAVNADGDGADGFMAHRRNQYLGRWIRYGGWYPDCEIRLYRRDRGRWEGGLFAKVAVRGKVGSLNHPYLHYPYRDISEQIQRADRYSRTAAEEMFQEGQRCRRVDLLFRPFFRFVKEYLLKAGFRDGVPGLVIITTTMFYVFMKYAKLWELIHAAGPNSTAQDSKDKGGPGVTP
jgi:glycosyltransferase involved in cell wall biosynthesis